nr:MAG TPA: hypothetical protein [Caudoviricetes sp.]DAY79125.1 MAG TPA: hypothetical protein [Caudoviricetes sp.]DAZ58888.1 MAG TPA: hypothetical protein [Caudoviricetes sp.]
MFKNNDTKTQYDHSHSLQYNNPLQGCYSL